MKYIITITQAKYDWQVPMIKSDEVYRQTFEDLDVADAVRRINEGNASSASAPPWFPIIKEQGDNA